MSKIERICAYLGGSFDPVHLGHLQLAMFVYHSLQASTVDYVSINVELLPNSRSPFKTEATSPEHRLAMLKRVVEGTPLAINELEIWQTPPVYSIDSVQALRQRHTNASLIFILGADSAVTLPKWHKGLELLDYMHLWVFPRQDIRTRSNLCQAWHDCPQLQNSLTADVSNLTKHRYGQVFFDESFMPAQDVQTKHLMEVSSSQIRLAIQSIYKQAMCQQGRLQQVATSNQSSINASIINASTIDQKQLSQIQNQLPQIHQSVLAYILENALYQ